jgi:DNA-binding transcriptional LysR family regulator
MATLPQARWIEERVNTTGEPLCRLRCNDADGLIAAIRTGTAKTLLPRLVATNLPELEEIPDFSDLPRRELWLMVHPNVATTTRVRVVIDWLSALFSDKNSHRGS